MAQSSWCCRVWVCRGHSGEKRDFWDGGAGSGPLADHDELINPTQWDVQLCMVHRGSGSSRHAFNYLSQHKQQNALILWSWGTAVSIWQGWSLLLPAGRLWAWPHLWGDGVPGPWLGTAPVGTLISAGTSACQTTMLARQVGLLLQHTWGGGGFEQEIIASHLFSECN